MRVLITSVGKRDPLAEDGTEGAIVVLSRHLTPAVILLFPTADLPGRDGTEGRVPDLTEYLRAVVPGAAVSATSLHSNPTDYQALLEELRPHVARIRHAFPNADFHVNVSSGTPQIGASWLLLIHSGLLPARAWKVLDPRYAPAADDRVREENLGFLREESLVARACAHLAEHGYARAADTLRELARGTAEPGRERLVQLLARLVEGYDLWDRLRYGEAANALGEVLDGGRKFARWGDL